MPNGHYHSAIIGLDAHFINKNGAQTTIDRVERALYLGTESTTSIEHDEVVCAVTLCQQAIDRMAQANKIDRANISTIIVSQENSENYAEIENSIQVNSVAEALSKLDEIINNNSVVALVGANLSLVEVVEGNELAINNTISFDQSFNGYQDCNGVAALLFANAEVVTNTNSYVYAWLKGYGLGYGLGNGSIDNRTIEQATSTAFDCAKVNGSDIELLEVSSLACNESATLESSSLINSYNYSADANTSNSDNCSKLLNTAISCARSVTGEGAGFSQVLGLLRTVIAIQQRYIPAISGWQQPSENKLSDWQRSSFYFPTESRPWYPNPSGKAHLAAYSCLAANNDYCHLILEEHNQKHNQTHNAIRRNGFIACSDLTMILVTGDSCKNLLLKLDALEQNNQSIKDIALTCYSDFNVNKSAYTATLICESKDELLKEIQLAKQGIETAFANQTEWRTPKGSYFTPVPVNDLSGEDVQSNQATNDQNVSFLYPGIGATYVGLGRDLFHLFPEIYHDVANLADDIGASLKDKLLNPRTIIRPDFKTLKQLDLNLRGSLADIAEAGVGFACVFTKVFENVFKVKADFATGYSMGEVSMYAALGAWQEPGLMSARLANSDTFNHRLCGELATLREHWGLDETNQDNPDELIWETYTIKATLDEVLTATEGETRVYCTIINTPDSLLLAGYPEDCLRVIKKLGVRAMPLNMANAIHSAPAKIEYDNMVELYTMDVTARLATKMYSSSCYLPIPQLSKAIAHSVAKCLCERVDFPRLVNTMYDKGARVFIEMGPGRSLCSWVDKILSVNPKANITSNVAVPVNAKGTSDELTYFRALAKLISHGVKLDIDTLFNGSIVVSKN